MFLVDLVLITISMVIVYSDIKERKISNRLNLAVLACCLLIAYENKSIELHILRGFIVVFFGMFLFSLGIIGAGDVKLFSAYALIIDSQFWLLTLVSITFVGGFVAIFILLKSKFLKSSRIRGVPYGFPIVVSSLFFIHLSAIS
ncbi:Type IV leader peptidase family protein [Grimontia celer]|uniref:Type IV leader peptidase family protein n=1 Tax=Grimontia celer TaxID=1796497 RepID=A0A128F2U4_9GAMM|nr:prepilin peptidase [Grimontia celer]CZF81113.1 Type IV leader peptidase family protein [Grimontia celer]